MAWRQTHNKASERLAVAKREWDKRAKAEQRRVTDKERADKFKLEEAEEQRKQKAREEAELEEKEQRKKETKKAEEDNAVSVRTKSLGKDRHARTYWWGVGGMKACVFVEDVDGGWGVFNTKNEVDTLMNALHSWGKNERVLKQSLQRRTHAMHAEFRKQARSEAEPGDEPDLQKEAPLRGPGGGPEVPADESTPFRDTVRRLGVICALAKAASGVRSDWTLGDPTGEAWVAFIKRATGASSNEHLAACLCDVEESLRAGQLKEFMDPREAADRAAAADAGEAYESDYEEEILEDDDYDDEQAFGDARDQETYESKAASGMIFPIFDTKFDRARWKEKVHKDAPAASLAFSCAALEDSAKPFLKALIKHPR